MRKENKDIEDEFLDEIEWFSLKLSNINVKFCLGIIDLNTNSNSIILRYFNLKVLFSFNLILNLAQRPDIQKPAKLKIKTTQSPYQNDNSFKFETTKAS